MATIVDVGGMREKCHTCHGAGWVNEVTSVSNHNHSEIEKLRADLEKMVAAYEALQDENKTLKAKLEKTKNNKKTSLKKLKNND